MDENCYSSFSQICSQTVLYSTVELALSCQNEEVIFQIKDEGIGIPAADQQRPFGHFIGVGMSAIYQVLTGASSCKKKLVDIHGGQITVASEGGYHTITLPLSQPESVECLTSLILETDQLVVQIAQVGYLNTVCLFSVLLTVREQSQACSRS